MYKYNSRYGFVLRCQCYHIQSDPGEKFSLMAARRLDGRETVVSYLSDNTRFIFVELCNARNGEINNLQFPTPTLSEHEAGGSRTSCTGTKKERKRASEQARCVQQPRLLQGRPVTMARVMIACPRLIISPLS